MSRKNIDRLANESSTVLQIMSLAIHAAYQPSDARIQSIARAKAILDVLADQHGWVRLRDIAVRTGLVKATVFNLVTALGCGLISA
jgi:IclR helix-turn-helix domain